MPITTAHSARPSGRLCDQDNQRLDVGQTNEPRQDQQPGHEHQHDDACKLVYQQRDGAQSQCLTRRERGDDGHQDDRDHVLHDQDAKDVGAYVGVHGADAQHGADHHGAGDGQRSPQAYAGRGGPADDGAHGKASPRQRTDLHPGRKARDGQDVQQTADPELQAHREHDEHNAHLGELTHAMWICEERNRNVGTDDQARQQVAQNARLPQPACEHAGHRCHHGDDPAVCDQIAVQLRIPQTSSSTHHVGGRQPERQAAVEPGLSLP